LLDLGYDGNVDRGWQPSFRVYSGNYRYEGNWRYAASSNSRDRAAADWVGSELHLAYANVPQHKLMFGIDAQWNTRVEQRYYETDPRNEILNTNNPSRVVSFFVQDEWRFHPEWLLNVGLRHDKYNDFAAVNSPRAALIWQPTPRLSLKAMAGQAYRVPNAYERFYNDGGITQIANPNLQPEHVKSTELAAAYRLGQSGRVSVSIYDNRMRDLIDLTADSTGISGYTNQSSVRAHGVEIDAENRWSGGYRLRGSIAWQQSKLADGALLVDSPKLLGKLIFGAPIAFGWTASGELLGRSSRRGDNGSVPGYGIVNLYLSTAPVARLGKFSLAIYNLGDRRYFDPTSAYLIQNAIEQDGRQLRLSWTLAL
jgi:iron complex outermembrane receptor protein